MNQFVKIFEGCENARMNADNWQKYSELVTAEEAPDESWYLVQKQAKPALQPGQILGWTYRIDKEDGIAFKEYFVWEEPKSISKRKLMNGLKGLGLWEGVKAYMEQKDIWEDFAMATTLDDNDPLIQTAITELVASGLVTEETLRGVIASSIAD